MAGRCRSPPLVFIGRTGASRLVGDRKYNTQNNPRTACPYSKEYVASSEQPQLLLDLKSQPCMFASFNWSNNHWALTTLIYHQGAVKGAIPICA
jgi:hypothetical protein